MLSVSWAVKKMIFAAGFCSRMRSVARMPAVVVSISTSMRITSKSTAIARACIASPLAALPTTSISGCC